MKKKLLKVASALALCTGLFGCGGGSNKGDNTIDVFILAPITGEVAEYGLAVSNGAKMALEEIGEVNGHKIKYTLLDTKGEDETAISNYEIAIASGADFIIGGVISSESTAIAQKSQSEGNNKITILSGSATADAFTLAGDNAFRICFTDPQQGVKMANFAYSDLGVRKTAVIYNNGSDYSIGCANSYRETFEKLGGSLAKDAFETYVGKDPDFTSVVAKVLATDPDVIYLPDYYENIYKLIKAIREQGYTKTIVGSDGWDGTNQCFIAANNCYYLTDCYFVNSFYENTDDSQKFIAAYQTKYGVKPISFGALGYDCGYVMKAAFEEAYKSTSSAVPTHAELNAAMYKLNVKVVTGTVAFDKNGNPTNAGCILTFNTSTGETVFVK